jgi:hypothetical protein
MDAVSFRNLLTDSGQEALVTAEALQPREVDYLQHFQVLNRLYPADLAQAALETAILRLEAIKKFPGADRMYFTRQALEQASSTEVSNYRAERYRPYGVAADLGCSIGGDTLPLAAAGFTTGIDLNPLRLAIAQANAQALGLSNKVQFFQADLCASLPLTPVPSSLSPNIALFFDPARRVDGRRIFRVNDYVPPLRIIKAWLPRYPAIGVKISPGVDLEELGSYDAEVEFISLRGELKEAVLWFGPLKTASRRATVLPGNHTLISDKEMDVQLSEPRATIYEPDPAVLRAGLVRFLGAQLGASQLDPDIAYLTADQRVNTPFARAWAVEAWFPFNLKRLRAYLRERSVGQVVVKKRGSPLQPETLIRDLRLTGYQERVIILTHLRGRHIVVVCTPR